MTEKLLTIGITSKDRIDELKKTLAILAESELKSCNIILINDGGSSSFLDLSYPELKLTIHNFTESAGLIERRNFLAKECNTPYMMSLDDDSAPTKGNIEDVLSVFTSHNDVAVVALNIFNQDEPAIDYPTDFEVCNYVGCGHVIDVDKFLSLGGYSGSLFYGHEEIEYCLKLAKEDYRVLHKSDYYIKHRRSMINRVVGFNERYHKNIGWIYGSYLGFYENIIQLFLYVKSRRSSKSLSEVSAYINGLSKAKNQSKLSFKQYFKWKKRKWSSVG